MRFTQIYTLSPGISFSMVIDNVVKTVDLALAGVAQWIEHQPANQKVAGSISSQSICLVAGQVLSWGHVRGN